MRQTQEWRWFTGLIIAVAATVPPAGTKAADLDDLDRYFDAPYDADYERTMVARIRGQITRYLDQLNERTAANRHNFWRRDLSSWSGHAASVAPNRQRLRRILGVVDQRDPASMEQFGPIHSEQSGLVAETRGYTIRQVRWDVLAGIRGEGLLLTPKQPPLANVVALPDADQTPEQLAGLISNEDAETEPFALRLVERGAQVLVPAMISRDTKFSGVSEAIPHRHWQQENGQFVAAWTNMSHREWSYRQAYVLGRHLIGYEIQKTLAAVDWFERQTPGLPIGVAGYGEGGLIAFYASALDDRIGSTLVSGYFGPREKLHEEPVERNVWGLLSEFGDAEIASLIAPRALTIEYSATPRLPPAPTRPRATPSERRIGARSKGRLTTPSFAAVANEAEQIKKLFAGQLEPAVTFVHGPAGALVQAGSVEAIDAFCEPLSVALDRAAAQEPPKPNFVVDGDARQQRQVEAISRHLLEAVHKSAEFRRYQYLDGDKSSPEAWTNSMRRYRDDLYDEMIGRLPDEAPPLNIRQRQVFDEPGWTGYETVLDVLPGVFGWGLLALPKDLREGERRPVVVVQHGHAGTPTTPWRVRSYNRILPKLCQRGFIVFAPFAPYQFDVRRATPLKASVYSILIPLHQQIARWLGTLSQVDADRIGFYGKSWGGRSALRIVPFVPEYRLAVCSAYFNQWPRKVMTPHYRLSYQYTSSIGVYEFDQGNTFGHAELAMLIAPRPFLVENGYDDAVMPAEWAAYEFAKVKRLYNQLGIGERAEFGAHLGGHEVHDDTVFPFLHRHLNWPVPPLR